MAGSRTLEHAPRGSAHLSLTARRRVQGAVGLVVGTGGFLVLWSLLSEFVVRGILLPSPLEIGEEMVPHRGPFRRRPVIARLWKGVVRLADADVYADYIRETGFAGYARTAGNLGT